MAASSKRRVPLASSSAGQQPSQPKPPPPSHSQQQPQVVQQQQPRPKQPQQPDVKALANEFALWVLADHQSASSSAATATAAAAAAGVVKVLGVLFRLLSVEADPVAVDALVHLWTVHQPQRTAVQAALRQRVGADPAAAVFAATALDALVTVVLQLDIRSLRQLRDHHRIQRHAPKLFAALQEHCSAVQTAAAVVGPASLPPSVAQTATRTSVLPSRSIVQASHSQTHNHQRDQSSIKAYDELFQIMRFALGIRQGANYRRDLTARVLKLLGELTDEGMDIFVAKFVNELLDQCDPAVSILKGFNEEIAITSDSLNRLSNLERRLTMTSTPNAGSHPNATSSSSQRSGPGSSGFGSNTTDVFQAANAFAGNEVFFSEFIYVADSHRFLSSLSVHLQARLLELNAWTLEPGAVVSPQYVRNRLLHLRVLAKFLAFSLFGPFWVKQGDQHRRQAMAPVRLALLGEVTLDDLLKEAAERRTLSATLAWMTEFVTIIPSQLHSRIQQQDARFITLLHVIARICKNTLARRKTEFPLTIDGAQITQIELTDRSALVIGFQIEDVFARLGGAGAGLTGLPSAFANNRVSFASVAKKSPGTTAGSVLAVDTHVEIQDDSWLQSCASRLSSGLVIIDQLALSTSSSSAAASSASSSLASPTKATSAAPSRTPSSSSASATSSSTANPASAARRQVTPLTTQMLSDAFRWQYRDEMSLVEFVTEKVVRGGHLVFVKAARSDIVAKFQIYFDRAVAQLGSQTFGDQESRQVALQELVTRDVTHAFQEDAAARILAHSVPRITAILRLLAPPDQDEAVKANITAVATEWANSVVASLVASTVASSEIVSQLKKHVTLGMDDCLVRESQQRQNSNSSQKDDTADDNDAQGDPPAEQDPLDNTMFNTLWMLQRRCASLLGTPLQDQRLMSTDQPLHSIAVAVLLDIRPPSNIARKFDADLFGPALLSVLAWLALSQVPKRLVSSDVYFAMIDAVLPAFFREEDEANASLQMLFDVERWAIWDPTELDTFKATLLRLLRLKLCSIAAVEFELVRALKAAPSSKALSSVAQSIVDLNGDNVTQLVFLRQALKK